jgi:hypothetical protein
LDFSFLSFFLFDVEDGRFFVDPLFAPLAGADAAVLTPVNDFNVVEGPLDEAASATTELLVMEAVGRSLGFCCNSMYCRRCLSCCSIDSDCIDTDDLDSAPLLFLGAANLLTVIVDDEDADLEDMPLDEAPFFIERGPLSAALLLWRTAPLVTFAVDDDVDVEAEDTEVFVGAEVVATNGMAADGTAAADAMILLIRLAPWSSFCRLGAGGSPQFKCNLRCGWRWGGDWDTARCFRLRPMPLRGFDTLPLRAA